MTIGSQQTPSQARGRLGPARTASAAALSCEEALSHSWGGLETAPAEDIYRGLSLGRSQRRQPLSPCGHLVSSFAAIRETKRLWAWGIVRVIGNEGLTTALLRPHGVPMSYIPDRALNLRSLSNCCFLGLFFFILSKLSHPHPLANWHDNQSLQCASRFWSMPRKTWL